MPKSSTLNKGLGLVAALGFAAAFTAPAAMAEPYGYYSSDDEVIIRPESRRVERGYTGAPVEWHHYSEAVHFGDLDLRTNYGVRVFRDRIRSAAYTACDRLDSLYPGDRADSPPCYRDTVARGMEQADEVIGQARGYD